MDKIQSAEDITIIEIYVDNLKSMFDLNQFDLTESLMKFDLTTLYELRKSLIQRCIKDHSIKSKKILNRKIKPTAISDISVLTTALVEEQTINSQVINKIFTINTEIRNNQSSGLISTGKLDQSNNRNQSQIINGLHNQIG